jgi:hypothetical protein
VSVPEWFLFLYFKYWYFRSLKRFWDCDLILSMSLNFIKAWRNDKWYNKRVLIWRFTLVLIKINYGQIGDQIGLFNTTNPVFNTTGNRFVRRTGTFGNLWFFSLVPSDNRNTRSTCPTSVFTGIGQMLMSWLAPFPTSTIDAWLLRY